MTPHSDHLPAWTLVLRADGAVEIVDGGAPSTWVGHSLFDLVDAPAPLLEAARELLALPPAASGLRTRHLGFSYDQAAVECELLLLEAVPLRRTLVKVDDLLLRTLDTFISQARASHVDITLERGKDLPPVLFLDGEKIAWVLTTLVGNALRAVVDAEATPKRKGHIVLAASWHGERRELVLAVRDTGRGMSEQQTRWLFDQDPSTGRSAGLALVMVRDVVTAHRGLVSAESQLGKGTTITVHLPRLSA